MPKTGASSLCCINILYCSINIMRYKWLNIAPHAPRSMQSSKAATFAFFLLGSARASCAILLERRP